MELLASLDPDIFQYSGSGFCYSMGLQSCIQVVTATADTQRSWNLIMKAMQVNCTKTTVVLFTYGSSTLHQKIIFRLHKIRLAINVSGYFRWLSLIDWWVIMSKWTDFSHFVPHLPTNVGVGARYKYTQFECTVPVHFDMLKLLIICVVALANGTRGQSDRIVGGSIAENNQFPHQASIRNRVDMQHLCGAAIITRKYLVTAASCVQFNFSKPDNILVVVGTRLNDLSGIFHSLKTIVPHPRFSDSTWQNDIALLNTENEIIFSDQVGPIQLPTQDPPPSGELPVVISGWGQFSVSNLNRSKFKPT